MSLKLMAVPGEHPAEETPMTLAVRWAFAGSAKVITSNELALLYETSSVALPLTALQATANRKMTVPEVSGEKNSSRASISPPAQSNGNMY
jgi:hypothetical protein